MKTMSKRKKSKTHLLVKGYAFGHALVGQHGFYADFIIFPDHMQPEWWRKQLHVLDVDDLKEVLEYQPKILVVGRGCADCLKLTDDLKNRLQDQGIRLIEDETSSAIPIFNTMIERNQDVVGAFHLGC